MREQIARMPTVFGGATGGALSDAVLEHDLNLLDKSFETTPARRQFAKISLAMAATDCLGISLALLLTHFVRYRTVVPSPKFWLLIAAAPVMTLVIFRSLQLYSVHKISGAEEFRRVLQGVVLIVASLVTMSFWLTVIHIRHWMLYFAVTGLVVTLVSRRAWRYQVYRLRRRGKLSFRTLIVGTNEEALHLSERIGLRPLGFAPLGFVSTTASHNGTRNGAKVLGHIDRLRQIIAETSADCVFVAGSAVGIDDVQQVLKARRLDGVDVRVTATFPKVLSTRITVQPVAGMMALSVSGVRLTGSQALAKRILDLVVGSVALVLVSPLLLAVAIAIKLTSPGPVIYRQHRVGKHGQEFEMLKFRSMVPGADLMVGALAARNEAGSGMFKIRNDPRVTKVGRVIRKLSIDELPQLVNVLKGEMSLVGPRPPLREEVDGYEEWQLDRLEVPPGCTGLWQVSGRSHLDFNDCVRLDLFYIENWSLSYDLFILAKTVWALLTARGAY